MKNVALVIPGFSNPDIRNMVFSLFPKISEKYDVSVFSFEGGYSDDPEIDAKTQTADIPLEQSGSIKRLVSQIKRIMALRKFVKEQNIRLLISLSEEIDFCLAYSFLPVKKTLICNSLPGLKKDIKKYHSMLKHSDALLFNSEIMKQIFEDKYPGTEDKLHVIVPPADTDAALEKSREPIPEEYKAFFESHKVITSYGPFSLEKCHWDILKSFEIVKSTISDAALVFIDEGGELSEDIHNMAERSAYASDILFINDQNPYKYIAASSVYVQASSEETSAVRLLEAMAFKVPVVAADCGAFSSDVLFEEYDPDFKCEKMTFADRGMIVPSFGGKPNYDYTVTYGIHLDLANAIKEMLLSDRIKSLLVDKAYGSLKDNSTDNTLKKYVDFVDKLYLCL